MAFTLLRFPLRIFAAKVMAMPASLGLADIACCGFLRQISRMFSNAHMDRLRQAFADQFLNDEHGLVYRKYQKGAPIRVSEMERERFVATFNKRIGYATWSIVPTTVGLILLLAWLIPDTDSPLAQMAVWVGIAAILVPFIAICYWAWNAPSRDLENRTPEGVALTKAEARELAFSKISYGQLALVALGGVGLVWKMSAKVDVFHGGGVVWLVLGVALILLAGGQAIRKWHFSQQRALNKHDRRQ